ncbi:hypothetical protein PBAL39_20885 [Pedobacter sp. BAL39]|uniref:pyridoxamine 5'-phosphate oxidase family protein n=1 Tax=Pedobacter sp. BAL39 TaxID=391596 RepID=UPI000155969C|nr:pyridoxamine 5'-phosphate oxidase family protein [Pedobacter sp. BAL39]EDM38568.1 hypothetical protein PBAL39_20885 [Pedobacter sp. BAL39]
MIENSLNMHEAISDFLQSQTVMTMATAIMDEPYCAPCFFAYNATHQVLVFKSDRETNHVKNALSNAQVAGSVLPDQLVKGRVRGLQFSGVLMNIANPENPSAAAEVHPPEAYITLADAKKSYYKKYPFALAIPGVIWIIRLHWIKFTDNTLGFGKKRIWELAAAHADE